ncbi:hypothetical protein HA402_002764 [Bradysia odoriphaga]|nr:hypothetical protein HA402_002764 [Bradysia odoriphaga]
MACLRRALNGTSRHSPKNLCVDELISILVFVIIKSGLTHWFATFKFLKDFILNDLTGLSDKGADSFLITTLEAAIVFIKTFNETKRPVDGPIPTVEPRSKFASKFDFIETLHSHIRAGHEPEVLRLLTSEKDIEIVKGNPSSASLCHPLCDCENCSAIIEERPNVNTPNSNGITPLHVASMNGLPKMVNLLLALEADLTATDENNWTALHYASARGHQNVLLLLLHAGAEINCQTNDKYTPLHFSCLNGHLGCVKALLYYSDHIKVKIDKNLPNKMGDTPLHLASTWGFVEIIETLLEYGVKIDRINRLGHTASDYAHNSFVTELLQHTFVMVDDDDSTNSWANESSNRKLELFRGYIDENALKADMELHRKTDNDKIIAAIRNGDLKLA